MKYEQVLDMIAVKNARLGEWVPVRNIDNIFLHTYSDQQLLRMKRVAFLRKYRTYRFFKRFLFSH